MEYVGDVLDDKLFRKRARRYAKDDVKHFYFMALTTELVIDASTKGNISRFINHSCDPNAVTQKVRGKKYCCSSANGVASITMYLTKLDRFLARISDNSE